MKLRHSDMPIAYICRLPGKTEQTYYYHIRYQAQLINNESLIITKVVSLREEMPGIGVSKLLHILTGHADFKEACPGRDKLYDLLRRHSLLLIRRVRRGPTTTNSRHRYMLYPNFIRGLVVDRPDLLWVSDITYLSTYAKFCYLSLITDAYSHPIVGYHVHHNLTTFGPATALRMALNTLDQDNIQELYHHSDRGSQYGSDAYIELLRSHTEIKISMTENGDPYENAIAERINGIGKHEFRLDQLFQTMSEMKAHVIKSINSYNETRPHASCDFLTPNQAHKGSGILAKRWKKNYKKKSLDELEFQELAGEKV